MSRILTFVQEEKTLFGGIRLNVQTTSADITRLTSEIDSHLLHKINYNATPRHPPIHHHLRVIDNQSGSRIF
ncbi:unnamed protein product [Hermetia illucens]|uniref:Uncharacterized protein n=1 Tax=Hermetia illucens TaxID=343691 RepID=A0A7R8UHN8_HERIL|nr:unnamed protein product [Hermetia illucens]